MALVNNSHRGVSGFFDFVLEASGVLSISRALSQSKFLNLKSTLVLGFIQTGVLNLVFSAVGETGCGMTSLRRSSFRRGFCGPTSLVWSRSSSSLIFLDSLCIERLESFGLWSVSLVGELMLLPAFEL
ncbi:hypothetical protein BpHYR1_046771 [Brachionus plicatilis]|uniref:Uncharacterized protein n=1 Tax=Brachionus plicatilis TaxID=10195 RepID=A0A3M7Q1F5_BRAPC|nr:hypothetical protein BpHYR1_046771 [Brachionus plicatilis]